LVRRAHPRRRTPKASLTLLTEGLSQRLESLSVEDHKSDRLHAQSPATAASPRRPTALRPAASGTSRVRDAYAPRPPHPVFSMDFLPDPFYPSSDTADFKKAIGNPAHRWYCVTKGYRVGVYYDWTQAKLLVDGCKGSIYKAGSFAECVRMYDLAYEEGRLRVVEVL
jgi:hypothetical protein